MSDDAKAQVRLTVNCCYKIAGIMCWTDLTTDMCLSLQALAAKEQGNELYKQKKFDEALKCYAIAFELYPQDMAFLSNRAGQFVLRVRVPVTHLFCRF